MKSLLDSKHGLFFICCVISFCFWKLEKMLGISEKNITSIKCQCILGRALIGDTFQIALEFRNVGF